MQSFRLFFLSDGFCFWVLNLIKMLFIDKIEGRNLYGLRSFIAHGDADTLNNYQKEQISNRIHSIREISISYIKKILKDVGIEFQIKKLKASFGLDMGNNLLSNERMYQGSTNIALYYHNRI